MQLKTKYDHKGHGQDQLPWQPAELETTLVKLHVSLSKMLLYLFKFKSEGMFVGGNSYV